MSDYELLDRLCLAVFGRGVDARLVHTGGSVYVLEFVPPNGRTYWATVDGADERNEITFLVCCYDFANDPDDEGYTVLENADTEAVRILFEALALPTEKKN